MVGAPGIVEVLELVLDRHDDPVEHGHLVGRADQRALGAGTVVTVDVDDQCVVELAHVFDCLDDAADLVVGVGNVRGKDIRLANKHLLLVGRKRIPALEQIVRPGREFSVAWNDAQLLLVGEDLVAQRVPPLVEKMHGTDLLDPLGCGVMWRMRAAWHVIHQERLLRCQRIDLVHVLDRLIGHRRGQVVAGVVLKWIDIRRVTGEVRRLPLVGVATHEPIEVFEAHAGGPLVEGADRGRLKRRRVVVLAEPRRTVAVVLQDLANRRLVLGDEAVVARVAGCLLGDDTEADRVMVAAGNQGGPRWRA